MPNKFHCKRCGACCKPGWLVNKNAGRPYTLLEKIKSLITRKPLPSRVYYTNWIRWFEEDIESAASFFGISFDEFVKKYELSDDTANLAAMHGLTKEQLLNKEARKRNISVSELKKQYPNLRAYQLYIAINKVERDCPFVACDGNNVHYCKVYAVRPDMCRQYPSDKQLQERFDFYAPHCPGFEKGEGEVDA